MVGAPADEVLAKLPAKVTVEQEDGIQRDVDVVWNIDGVKLDKAGTYEAVGTIAGTDVQAKVKVIVGEEAVIDTLTPAELKASAKEGATAEEVYAKLKKDIVATYTDGTTKELTLSGWDYSKVDFSKAGTYEATGKLSLDGTEIEKTIPIKVTITKEGGGTTKPVTKPNIPGGNNSDWKWPEGSGSGSDSGKKNPNSGDSSMLPIALAVLAASAG
ncbi:Ig-like domain-containing protein, partial [Zongyangia hominis]